MTRRNGNSPVRGGEKNSPAGATKANKGREWHTLEQRIHGGDGAHRTDGKCPCRVWDEQGFNRPGSLSGRKA